MNLNSEFVNHVKIFQRFCFWKRMDHFQACDVSQKVREFLAHLRLKVRAHTHSVLVRGENVNA